jgi:hypothetical protein
MLKRLLERLGGEEALLERVKACLTRDWRALQAAKGRPDAKAPERAQMPEMAAPQQTVGEQAKSFLKNASIKSASSW